MVAEAIREELQAWHAGRGAIAALSFTRVGGEEIQAALAHELSHPHFVGTIDAFLFRYVVRPHLRALDPQAKPPELIAAEWHPAEIWTSKTFFKGINPFACVWTGRDGDGQPVLSQVNRYGVVTELQKHERDAVIDFKRKLRRDYGRITISDSALFASLILSHPKHGSSVRAELTRRFPLIVVDELQDTGVFLSESVRSLLEEPCTRGLLVGDPDQSIYEFNGAVPKMFDAFGAIAGAEELALATTQRCPSTAAGVASHLKRSNGPLKPASSGAGQAVLVRYEDMRGDVFAIARAFRRAEPGDTIKVVARSNSTVEELTGRRGKEVPSLGCRPAALLHRAVRHFRRGKAVAALAAARTALEWVVLDGEGFTDDEVRARGVEPRMLREVAIRCMLAADSIPTTGSAIQWQIQALGVLTSHAAVFCAGSGLPTPKEWKKPKKIAGHDTPVAQSIPAPGEEAGLEGVPVLTVHGVKGETHDVTIFVVPPTSGKGSSKKCPSVVWWPEGDADDEERRIAYVALTRTRRDLVVCVDAPSYVRLQESRVDFVAGFECFTVAELLARIEPSLVPEPAVSA